MRIMDQTNGQPFIMLMIADEFHFQNWVDSVAWVNKKKKQIRYSKQALQAK